MILRDHDLQAWALADLATALLIRAISDAKGRIQDIPGADPTALQAEARAFLLGSTPEWDESRRFWLRLAGIDLQWFQSVLLPRLFPGS